MEERIQNTIDDGQDGTGEINEEQFITGYMKLTGSAYNQARNAYIFLEVFPRSHVDTLRAADLN